MEWYLAALRKYAAFSGRSRRKEYWMFALINALISIALVFATGMTSESPGLVGSLLYLLYSVVMLVPGLSVSVRRLHDTGRSGWWLLVAIVPIVGAIALIVFMAQDGQPGDNEFGANPKSAFA